MTINRMAMTAVAVMGFLAMGAVEANAATLNLVGLDTARGSSVTVNYNGNNISGFAGALRFSIDGSSNLVDMFCVDITTHALMNSAYEAVALPPVPTIDNGAQAAWLFVNYSPLANDIISGTALQLALWDVVHDGGNGLATGLFRSTSSISDAIVIKANEYISASSGQSAMNAVVWQSVLGKNDRQSMISSVPEPGTWAMMVSGVALIALGARRKKVVA